MTVHRRRFFKRSSEDVTAHRFRRFRRADGERLETLPGPATEAEWLVDMVERGQMTVVEVRKLVEVPLRIRRVLEAYDHHHITATLKLRDEILRKFFATMFARATATP